MLMLRCEVKALSIDDAVACCFCYAACYVCFMSAFPCAAWYAITEGRLFCWLTTDRHCPVAIIQAPQAGEVVSFYLDDGAPVEYKQKILEIAPFFGGHIIGDSKYA